MLEKQFSVFVIGFYGKNDKDLEYPVEKKMYGVRFIKIQIDPNLETNWYKLEWHENSCYSMAN